MSLDQFHTAQSVNLDIALTARFYLFDIIHIQYNPRRNVQESPEKRANLSDSSLRA